MRSRERRIRLAVEDRYSKFASNGHRGGCCGIVDSTLPSRATEVALGCGSPLDSARVYHGMTVLDLGCGAGMDVFAASRKVGPSGRVIGVDSTVKMVARARRAATENGYTNVDFRQGIMEDLPVESGLVDLVISNCAVNLVPNKRKAYREMHRVLKPGSQLVISDIIAERDLPAIARRDLNKWSRCMGGALTLKGLKRILTATGFTDFRILEKREWSQGRAEGLPLLSATFSATKA